MQEPKFNFNFGVNKNIMKTLLPMTDFVLSEIKEPYTDSERLRVITNYATFLKQPLKLEMFVPVDEGGNVLEQPCEIMEIKDCRDCACREYLKAKEKVLFGFKPQFDIGVIKHHISQCRNIEYLANFGSIELTPTAIKQIGI